MARVNVRVSKHFLPHRAGLAFGRHGRVVDKWTKCTHSPLTDSLVIRGDYGVYNLHTQAEIQVIVKEKALLNVSFDLMI